MTQQNRERIERAMGIAEGLSWVAEEKMGEALIVVVEILDSVIKSEGENDK